MAAAGGIILNAIHRFNVCPTVFPGALSQVRHYAARKGTREKARKKKVKVEPVKLSFAEKVRRSKKIAIVKPEALTLTDDLKPEAIDDVYFYDSFKFKKYPFAEAIQCHREIFHPTMYDGPESLVKIFVELNMQGVKKTKPVEAFNRMISVRHPFKHGEDRNVLVFCKDENQIKDALDAGAALAGGSDIVKLIMDGELSVHNYDVVIAHPTMMPEVLTLRGLLKRKHPSIKGGTMGPDLKHMLHTQLHGARYFVKPYDNFPEYGSTTIPIGLLNMDVKHLEENMEDSINSIMSAKPKRPGSFITRIRVECPPSIERLQIDHSLYIAEEEIPVAKKKGAAAAAAVEEDEEEEEVEDDGSAVAVPTH